MNRELLSHTVMTRFGVCALVVLLFVANAAMAIQPKKWVHTTEADFEPGESENTLVTNLGDIKLAAGTRIIGEMPEQASVVFDLQHLPDGSLYIAAGPEAKLLKRNGDKIDTVLSLDSEQIFSLDVTADGKLLLGLSGENSRLAVLEGDDLKDLVVLEGVRYIWDMIVDGKSIYLATGTEGKLLRIDLDKEDDQKRKPGITELLDSEQTNLLCIGRDEKGRIYAGTDTDGLVYRVSFKEDGTPQPFVLYDAPEPEIGALLVLPNGTVYAGTADANQARPGRLSKASKIQSGRPEVKDAAPAKPDVKDLPGAKPDPEPAKDAPKQAAPAKAEPTAKPVEPAPQQVPEAKPQQQQGGAPAAPSMWSGLDPVDLLAQVGIDSKPIFLADNQKNESKNGKATPEQKESAATTAQQRDELRAIIRARLEKAREGGTLQASPGGFQRQTPKPSATGRRAIAIKPKAAKTKGNAIYRISPQGFVGEVFRESVMILKITLDGKKLVVATGNEGQIFRVDPFAQETTTLAELEPQQITTMLRTPNGDLLLGTANPATLVQLDSGFAEEGTYLSPVLDAKQISLWGALHIVADVPKGTTVAIETRSGNVEDPEKAPWSDWSRRQQVIHDEKAKPMAPNEGKVSSPPARFLQYRLIFNGNKGATATVDKIDIAYVTPNLRPSVRAITATYGKAAPSSSKSSSAGAKAEPKHQSVLNLTWKAVDPNGDRLTYRVEYQFAKSDKWIELARDLDKNRYEWETRRVPDGRYLVRVIASDVADNPPGSELTNSRKSDPILVDNTPPVFVGLKGARKDGLVLIEGKVSDALSTVKSVSYTVDAADDWVLVLPKDAIFDSTSESLLIKIADLAPGPHVITLRAVDDVNNAAYKAVLVNE